MPSRPTNSNPVPFFGTGFFGKAVKAYSQFAASVSYLPTGLTANPSLATGQFFCCDVSEPSHTERPNDLNSTMTETKKREASLPPKVFHSFPSAMEQIYGLCSDRDTKEQQDTTAPVSI